MWVRYDVDLAALWQRYRVYQASPARWDAWRWADETRQRLDRRNTATDNVKTTGNRRRTRTTARLIA